MANNPYVNKVEYGNRTIMDLTNDDVTEDDVLQGKSFHDRSGAPQTGSLVVHEIKPTPDSSLTEDDVVEYTRLKENVPANEEVPSVFGMANWSNLKRIRVVCPAQNLIGAHTGIGTWDDTENEADWWQNNNFKYLDPSYKQTILDPNGYDVDLDVKSDPTGETVLLAGYRVDTETGKMCIMFANYVIDPSKIKIVVDITLTRTDVG